MMNTYDLAGKTALVTGARRGIGKAIALLFGRSGANVAVADISREDCERVAAEIVSAGGHALALQMDVSVEASIEQAVNETVRRFQRIDILVNNAGIYVQQDLESMDTTAIDNLIAVNLRGVILCTKHVLAGMKSRKYGKIVNIASIAGFVGFELSGVYSATKGGVINFTRELALDLGRYRINVNAIAPGSIATPMTDDMLKNEQMKKSLLAKIPYGRIGRPEDIAAAAAFLATDDAEYITGDTLIVDGGWLTS